MGSEGGKAVLKKYGTEHFSAIGKIGFQVTTDKYFNGDRQAHLNWLQRKGWYSLDHGTSYRKPALYGDPGPHPAEFSKWLEWLRHAESNTTPQISVFDDPMGQDYLEP